MAWQYCDNCHAGIDSPDLTTRLIGERECPGCGEPIEIAGFSHAENMAELMELLEGYERRIVELEQTLMVEGIGRRE